MANLDSREKRASAINVMPYVMLPLPDGTIDTGDRIQAAGHYSGLSAFISAPAADVLLETLYFGISG